MPLKRFNRILRERVGGWVGGAGGGGGGGGGGGECEREFLSLTSRQRHRLFVLRTSEGSREGGRLPDLSLLHKDKGLGTNACHCYSYNTTNIS